MLDDVCCHKCRINWLRYGNKSLKNERDFYKKSSESYRLRYEDSYLHFKDKCAYWKLRESRIQELREENIVLQSEIEKLKSDLENANVCYRQTRGES